ncbi:MAG: hypothetical protein M1832_002587 [Thelocarpon impressellum]|nr:MAG: hypothetical protein M1832_002587 [Thelocarpon impressellum]
MTIDITVLKGSKEGKIVKSTTHKDGLKDDEVLLKVTHSGLCGTDHVYKHQDMVLGHEGVGIVQEVGKDVTTFKVGDRAGFGYQHDSCGHCGECLSGRETYCPGRHFYGTHELDQGSMASHAVWRAAFLFAIPEAIKSEDASPLMCGGATVFNILYTYGVGSTDRVGIIGVGGLGHFAIQFAAKMGCEVVVFSSTESKKAEVEGLGATEIYATKGKTELKLERPINHLIVTTSAQPDWKLYLPTLAPGARIFPLSITMDDFTIPYLPLLLGGIRIQGSIVAARHVLRKMLDFAAFHQIKPIIQTFPLTVEGLEQAFERLEGGQMRYRGVLLAQD